MKTNKILLYSCFGLYVIFLNFGCSTTKVPEPDGDNGSKGTFSVFHNDKNFAGKTERVTVPYEGKTFEISIKAEKSEKWEISTTDVNPSNFLSVTPMGNGSGEKTIKIITAKNESKESGRIGTVVIKNSFNKESTKFIFDQKEKELFIPEDVVNQKRTDFYRKDSKFNIYHMVEGPNVAIFYESKWGNSPELDPNLPLDREKALAYSEDIYSWMIDKGGFANWTTSEAAKYKLLIFVHYSKEGGAVGYGKPNVGITELKQPGMMNVNKYGVSGLLQHEIMHCFQYITHYDGAFNYGWAGPIYEMTSQWALLTRFPDWPDLEYNHFKTFMQNTHRAFLHEDNQYNAPYFLSFWEHKRKNMVSKLWQGNIESDNRDPVVTYKRLNNLTQEQFNDEMFEGASRFVTWDIPHLRDANAKHIDKHQYKLREISASKFQADPETCPQNYGYNVIKLKAPVAGTNVVIDFKGNLNLNGFKVKNSVYKGWRYGFVALKENGERIYGAMNKDESKRVTFTVPEGGIKYLWFVVMGAPTTHWKHIQSSSTTNNENNWPYEITLNGTVLDSPTVL